MTPAALAPSAVEIPASHVDLLARPVCAVLTTLGDDGQPESSLVWVGFDGECATFNATLERRKARNLLRDPRSSLLVVDPGDTSRFIQIRGDAQLIREGAHEHLAGLAQRYTGHDRFHGDVVPAARQRRETRVMGRIRARRITLDAVHA